MVATRIRLMLAVVALMLTASHSRGDDSLDAFWAAARAGDLPTIEKLVTAGVDVNAATEYGATALSFASDKGHLSVVRFLLEKGADPNSVDTFYKATPLTWAVQNGHTAVAVELAVHGASDAGKVLAKVAESGETKLLARLIKTGKFDAGILTRALMSAKPDDAKTIAMLTEAGAKPVSAVSTELLDEYAGKYQLQPGFIIDVSRSGDKLMAQLTGQPEFQIYAESDTTFFWTVVEATLTFVRNGDGKINRAVLRQMGRTMPAPRMGAEPDEPVDPTVVGKYVGLYESDDGAAFRVAIENGQLAIGPDGRTPSPLRAMGGHVFQASGGTKVSVTFTVDGDAVTGYVVDTGTEKLVRKRVGEAAPVAAQAAKSYARTKSTHWPSFRGAHACGVADGQDAPTKWDAETGEGIKWKTAIPGLGLSSPVVWGERLFITTAVSANESEFRAGPYGDVKSADDSSEHE